MTHRGENTRDLAAVPDGNLNGLQPGLLHRPDQPYDPGNGARVSAWPA